MKKTVVASMLCVAFFAVSTYAQKPVVGLYADALGSNCNITVATPGVVKFYVVVTGTNPVTAVDFAAPKPACLTGSFLYDEQPFPVTFGNSQTAVTVGFPGCLLGPLHVLTIDYIVEGPSPLCCYYDVEPDPYQPSGQVELVDCGYNLVYADGLTSTINGNETCPCFTGPPSYSQPTNPSPSDGAVNQPVNVTLTWDVTFPENGPFTYDVCFGAYPLDPLPIVAGGLTEPEWDPVGLLQRGRIYLWRIVVHDSAGHRISGPVWSFSTASEDAAMSVGLSYDVAYCGVVPNDTLTVDLGLIDSAVPTDAWGVDVTYDPSVMTFVGCENGALTAGWPDPACSNLGASIAVSGTNTTAIPVGSTGTLVRLRYIVDVCGLTEPGGTTICAENLTEDIALVAPSCADLAYAIFSQDGDVNDNGQVSPQDALCAFKGYLSFPVPPPAECAQPGWDVRSDVDCSEDITPGDALCIFEHWLDGSCAFCGGGPTVAANRPASALAPALSIGTLSDEKDEIALSVHASGVTGMRAFGFEMTYPATLEFVGIARTAATGRFLALDARVVADRRLRTGGYSHDPIASDDEDIVVLRFRKASTLAGGTLVIEEFVDDLAGAAAVTYTLPASDEETPPVTQYRLYQNHPNPFNPATTIQYEIPAGVSSVRVRLDIYDVQGRKIRALMDEVRSGGVQYAEWDGLDDRGQTVSSGVYFYVLRAGDKTLTRKMALLK